MSRWRAELAGRRQWGLPHRACGPEELGLLRLLVYGAWFLLFTRMDPERAAAMPRAMFQADGLLALLPDGMWDALLSRGGLEALKWVGLAATAAAALGLRPWPLAGVLAACSALLYDGMGKGFGGFHNHGQFAALAGAWLLLVFPAADGLALGRRRGGRDPRVYAAPLFVAAAATLLAYHFVGSVRFFRGDWSLLVNESMRIWFATRTVEYIGDPRGLGVLLTEHRALYALVLAGFWVVTAMEILSPLALVHRAFRWVWLAVMIPFHAATHFTMYILFWENMLLLLVVMTPLPRLLRPRDLREGAELFIDGECVLCHGVAKWIARFDPGGRVRIGALQGETARQRGIPLPQGDPGGWSVVLWMDGRVLERSDAVLGVFGVLGGWWGFLRVFALVPRPLRDEAYRWVAGRRYRLFGQHDACSLPSVEDRERLLP